MSPSEPDKMDTEIFAQYLAEYVDDAVQDKSLMNVLSEFHVQSSRAREMVEDQIQLNSAMQAALSDLAPSNLFDSEVMNRVRVASSIISEPSIKMRNSLSQFLELRDEQDASSPTVGLSTPSPSMLDRLRVVGPVMLVLLVALSILAALKGDASQPVARCDRWPAGTRVLAWQDHAWRRVERNILESGDRLVIPSGKERAEIRFSGALDKSKLIISSGHFQFEKHEEKVVVYAYEGSAQLALTFNNGPPVTFVIGQVTVDKIAGDLTLSVTADGSVSVSAGSGEMYIRHAKGKPIKVTAGRSVTVKQSGTPATDK